MMASAPRSTALLTFSYSISRSVRSGRSRLTLIFVLSIEPRALGEMHVCCARDDHLPVPSAP